MRSPYVWDCCQELVLEAIVDRVAELELLKVGFVETIVFNDLELSCTC